MPPLRRDGCHRPSRHIEGRVLIIAVRPVSGQSRALDSPARGLRSPQVRPGCPSEIADFPADCAAVADLPDTGTPRPPTTPHRLPGCRRWPLRLGAVLGCVSPPGVGLGGSGHGGLPAGARLVQPPDHFRPSRPRTIGSDRGAPTLEDRMQDLRAVMDAAHSERAALFGLSEGGPMSMLFAATYPDRGPRLSCYTELLPADDPSR